MTTRSAGILLHRRESGRRARCCSAHMGGPFWAQQGRRGLVDPEGRVRRRRAAEAAARREFAEELGLAVPPGTCAPLGDLRVSGGKVLTVWALEGDLDVDAVVPGMFELEWPPRSGTLQEFPEIDRAAWFDLADGAAKLVKGQRPYLDRLAALLPDPDGRLSRPAAPSAARVPVISGVKTASASQQAAQQRAVQMQHGLEAGAPVGPVLTRPTSPAGSGTSLHQLERATPPEIANGAASAPSAAPRRSAVDQGGGHREVCVHTVAPLRVWTPPSGWTTQERARAAHRS